MSDGQLIDADRQCSLAHVPHWHNDTSSLCWGWHAGMEVRVREAELSTNDEGLATDVFKLTTLQGTPLPDSRAKEVVERVRLNALPNKCSSSTSASDAVNLII